MYLFGLRRKHFCNTHHNPRTYCDQLKIGCMSSEHWTVCADNLLVQKKAPQRRANIFWSISSDVWFTGLWWNIMKTDLFPYYYNKDKSITLHMTGLSLPPSQICMGLRMVAIKISALSPIFPLFLLLSLEPGLCLCCQMMTWKTDLWRDENKYCCLHSKTAEGRCCILELSCRFKFLQRHQR